MGFAFPQTFEGWLPLLVPLVTVLFGLVYFLFPRMSLTFSGLGGAQGHPEAVGEGRSTFSGFLIGLPVTAILFQQPVLYFALGACWMLVAFGRMVHIIGDGALSVIHGVRFVIAFGFGAASLYLVGADNMPVGQMGFVVPENSVHWLPIISALVTVVFGLICLSMPKMALAMMRLAPIASKAQRNSDVSSEADLVANGDDLPHDSQRFTATGEVRALPGGFYLGLGLLVLLMPVQAMIGMFLQIALGFCWALTAFGRVIAMLSDGANNWFNWMSLLLELVLATLPLLIVFGIVSG